MKGNISSICLGLTDLSEKIVKFGYYFSISLF